MMGTNNVAGGIGSFLDQYEAGCKRYASAMDRLISKYEDLAEHEDTTLEIDLNVFGASDNEGSVKSGSDDVLAWSDDEEANSDISADSEENNKAVKPVAKRSSLLSDITYLMNDSDAAKEPSDAETLSSISSVSDLLKEDEVDGDIASAETDDSEVLLITDEDISDGEGHTSFHQSHTSDPDGANGALLTHASQKCISGSNTSTVELITHPYQIQESKIDQYKGLDSKSGRFLLNKRKQAHSPKEEVQSNSEEYKHDDTARGNLLLTPKHQRYPHSPRNGQKITPPRRQSFALEGLSSLGHSPSTRGDKSYCSGRTHSSRDLLCSPRSQTLSSVTYRDQTSSSPRQQMDSHRGLGHTHSSRDLLCSPRSQTLSSVTYRDQTSSSPRQQTDSHRGLVYTPCHEVCTNGHTPSSRDHHCSHKLQRDSLKKHVHTSREEMHMYSQEHNQTLPSVTYDQISSSPRQQTDSHRGLGRTHSSRDLLCSPRSQTLSNVTYHDQISSSPRQQTDSHRELVNTPCREVCTNGHTPSLRDHHDSPKLQRDSLKKHVYASREEMHMYSQEHNQTLSNVTYHDQTSSSPRQQTDSHRGLGRTHSSRDLLCSPRSQTLSNVTYDQISSSPRQQTDSHRGLVNTPCREVCTNGHTPSLRDHHNSPKLQRDSLKKHVYASREEMHMCSQEHNQTLSNVTYEQTSSSPRQQMDSHRGLVYIPSPRQQTDSREEMHMYCSREHNQRHPQVYDNFAKQTEPIMCRSLPRKQFCIADSNFDNKKPKLRNNDEYHTKQRVSFTRDSFRFVQNINNVIETPGSTKVEKWLKSLPSEFNP